MTDEQIRQHLTEYPDRAVTVMGRDYIYNGWIVTVFRKRRQRAGWRCVIEDKHGRLFIHSAHQVAVADAKAQADLNDG
jgi:hypothetical protein